MRLFYKKLRENQDIDSHTVKQEKAIRPCEFHMPELPSINTFILSGITVDGINVYNETIYFGVV